MHRIDGEGATNDNKFTEGNPSTGALATTVTADWCNAVQEEIIAVLTEAGIAPVKANNGQLVAAILSLIAGGGVAVTAEGVSILDAGSFFSGNNVEDALQQLAAKVYTGTFASNQVRRTVLALNGASFQTDPTHNENIVQLSNASAITYTLRPDSDYNAPLGTAIEIVQAGAGKVSFVAGAGVTLRKPAVFNAATLGQDAVVVLYKVDVNTWRLGGMLEAA